MLDIDKALGPQTVVADDAEHRVARLQPLAGPLPDIDHDAGDRRDDSPPLDRTLSHLQIVFRRGDGPLSGGLVMRGLLDLELGIFDRDAKLFDLRGGDDARDFAIGVVGLFQLQLGQLQRLPGLTDFHVAERPDVRRGPGRSGPC